MPPAPVLNASRNGTWLDDTDTAPVPTGGMRLRLTLPRISRYDSRRNANLDPTGT